MRISERTRSLIFCAVLAALPSCMAAQAVRPSAPKPTGVAPTLRRVLDELGARDRALTSFRGQAKLDFKSPEQSFRSTQFVVVHAPASARIDVINPFGVSYSVATDGKLLSAYDRRQSVFYQGQALAESFRRFIGIPMGAADFAAVLRGLPPGLGELRWSAAQAAAGGWMFKRRLGSGGVLELLVDPTTLDPLHVRISGDRERHEVEVQYSDFRDAEGARVAHQIDVSFKDGTHLGVVYKSVQHDVALAEGAFHIDRPPGSRLVNIDAEAGHGT